MPIDREFLTLAQWFSPAFPVGAFSYSHGIEWAVQAGDIYDAASLAAWLEDILQSGTGRADALFLAAAYRAATPEALEEINALNRAFASSRERRLETDAQGAAFGNAVAHLTGKPETTLTYPVAVGAAACDAGLALHSTSAFYLHAFLSNLVGAGQRLAPIGQSEAQAIIRDLAPLCSDLAEETSHGDLSELSNTAFLSDIAAMKHETQYSRIFRT